MDQLELLMWKNEVHGMPFGCVLATTTVDLSSVQVVGVITGPGPHGFNVGTCIHWVDVKLYMKELILVVSLMVVPP